MSLHAQRDGSNNISLRFIHKSLAAVADAYAAEINIRKVSLSKLDSSSIPVKFSPKPLLPLTGLANAQEEEEAAPSAPNSHGTDSPPAQQHSPVPCPTRSEDTNTELIGQPKVAMPPMQNMPHVAEQFLTTSVNSTDQKAKEMSEPETQPQREVLSSQDVRRDTMNSPASSPAKLSATNPPLDCFKPTSVLAIAPPRITTGEQALPAHVTVVTATVSPVTSTEVTVADMAKAAASSQAMVTPITIAPVTESSAPIAPITIAPVSLTPGVPGPIMSQLKRSYPNEASQVSPPSGHMNGDMPRHSQSPNHEENSEANKSLGIDNFSNGLNPPPNKKKRGPRQYKCDICGAEFVYAGVYSKHMWKHNRYSKTSPTPEMSSMLNIASLQQGMPSVRTSMANILAQQGTSVPLDMSSQSKLANIPQVPSLGPPHMAKLTNQVPPNFLNTSVELKKNENGGGNMSSIDACDQDQADDNGLYADDTLAEVHMEKKEGAGYDCWICGRPFHYRPPFIRHMRGAHEIRVIFDENRASNKTGKIFTCKLCSQSFLYQLPFEKHMKLIHGASMDSVSAKMIDIRDQREHHLPSLALDAFDNIKNRAQVSPQIKSEGNIMNTESISNSPLQKMSMAAKGHGLVSKDGLSTQMPVSVGQVMVSAVAQTMASNLPTMVSAMTSQTSQSNSPEHSPKVMSKESDYILIDSSGNHVMFGDKLQCFVCSERFTDKRLYLVHMQNEHGIQPKEENSPFKAVGTKTGKVFNCHLCQRRFSYKGPYEKHMRSHGINLVVLEKEVTQESLYCEICGKVFAYQLPYEKHMRNVHNIGIPLKSTSQQLYYRQDYRMTHQCEICFRSFATMQSLVKHVVNKHQNQISGQFSSPEYSQGLRGEGASSHENSMDMPMPEADRESGSEPEELPHRVYLDPNSVLKDLSSILPPEDDDDGDLKHPEKPMGSESPTEMEPTSESDAGADPGERKVEPARVQDPDSMLSMIKCEICNKMFRYKIAFSKHIQQMHSDEFDPNNDQLNNNNKLEVPDQAVQEAAEEDEKIVDKMALSEPSSDSDMPVDYSSPKKKHAVEEQKKSPARIMDGDETIPCQNAVENNN